MFQTYFQVSKNLYTFIGKVCIFGLISVLVSICYTIWIGKLVKHLIKSIKLYKENKIKDFRDPRERIRNLYNYETHIVKDVILIMISSAEISEPIFAIVTGIFISIYAFIFDYRSYPQFNTTNTSFRCTFSQTARQINSQLNAKLFPVFWIIYITTIMIFGCMGFIILLSFLTQYLAKRYFLHPVRRTCIAHLALVLIQFAIIFCLTNRDTTVLFLILVPLIILFDWCILVRNSKILYRVLKSNVRDLKLHLSNRHLYREQLRLLQIYKIFMPILLAALFFGVCALFSHFYLYIVIPLFSSHCFNSAIGHASTSKSYSLPSRLIFYLYNVSGYSTLILLTIHFILLGFPIFSFSAGMLITACAEKLFHKKKENLFRFNHQNCREALIRNNLTPLY